MAERTPEQQPSQRDHQHLLTPYEIQHLQNDNRSSTRKIEDVFSNTDQ